MELLMKVARAVDHSVLVGILVALALAAVYLVAITVASLAVRAWAKRKTGGALGRASGWKGERYRITVSDASRYARGDSIQVDGLLFQVVDVSGDVLTVRKLATVDR